MIAVKDDWSGDKTGKCEDIRNRIDILMRSGFLGSISVDQGFTVKLSSETLPPERDRLDHVVGEMRHGKLLGDAKYPQQGQPDRVVETRKEIFSAHL